MEENKFLVHLWTLVAVTMTTLAIVLSMAVSNSNRAELIKTALVRGQDPVTAICAYDQPQQAGTVVLCANAIASGTK